MSEVAQEAGQRVKAIRADRLAKRKEAGLPAFDVCTYDQLGEAIERDAQENPRFFEWDEQTQVYHVYWGGYDYEVDYDRCRTPVELLGWLIHIAEKDWELATGRRLGALARSIASRRGWDIYSW